MNKEKEKVILILGSSGGLGTELIRFFENKPFRLALNYLTNPPNTSTKNIKTYQADISNEVEVKNLIASVIADFGKIDVVVHNAGVSRNGMSWKIDQKDWEETLKVNLTGPFLVSKHVIPHMRDANFGRLIFMSSVVAQTGVIGTAAYAASKAGLIGLSKTLSKELANKNITVNAIALGYFNAGMINDVPKEAQDELKTKIPLGELGDPEQLGHLVEYLSSENANYITGQTLNLNGGLHN